MSGLPSTTWPCPHCTFLNDTSTNSCSLCGAVKSNSSPCNIQPPSPSDCGKVFYRLKEFTKQELIEIETQMKAKTNNESIKHPIILYTSNNMNMNRDPQNTQPLLNGIETDIGAYDRLFSIGIACIYYKSLLNYYRKTDYLPIFVNFCKTIDIQFLEIQMQYLFKGYDIIIPAPNASLLDSYPEIYFKNSQQIIYHRIGIGLNHMLPQSYLLYIQSKLDSLLIIENIEKKAETESKTNDSPVEDDENNDDIIYNSQLIPFSTNDPIEIYNDIKDVWIRGVFLSKTDDLYFVEIPDILESKFIHVPLKYVRYLDIELLLMMKECKIDDNEHKINDEIKVDNEDDNWSMVNDFVLREYILDVIEAIPDLLPQQNPNAFLDKMAILGITSKESCVRIVQIWRDIKTEQKKEEKLISNKSVSNVSNVSYASEFEYFISSNDPTKKYIFHIMKDTPVDNGLYDGEYKCRYYCKNKKHLKNGIKFHQCLHAVICHPCFIQYIKYCVKKEKLPKCKKCYGVLDVKDIELHLKCDADVQNEMIESLQKYQSMKSSDSEMDSDSNSENESISSKSDSYSDSGTDSYTDSDSDSSKSEIIIEDDEVLDIKNDKIIETKDFKKRKKKGYFDCADGECSGFIFIKSKSKRKYKKKFKCPKCKAKNCIACESLVIYLLMYIYDECVFFSLAIHKKGKKNRKMSCEHYQFLYKNEFLSNWKKLPTNMKKSKMSKAYKIKRGRKEWNFVLSFLMANYGQNKQNMQLFGNQLNGNFGVMPNINRIERIQNSRLWYAYHKYCKSLIKKRMEIDQMCVWHGSRGTHPSLIWSQNGFDVRFARVGGCIWFAVQNTYSMNGYQYALSPSENQVFLAFVACGDVQSVKKIRGNLILNVYKNECMYPAYLITYM